MSHHELNIETLILLIVFPSPPSIHDVENIVCLLARSLALPLVDVYLESISIFHIQAVIPSMYITRTVRVSQHVCLFVCLFVCCVCVTPLLLTYRNRV